MKIHLLNYNKRILNILLILCCCFISCTVDTSIDKEKAIEDVKNTLHLETQYFVSQEFGKLLEFYAKGSETTIISNIPLDPGKTLYIRGYDAIHKVYNSFNTEVTDLAFSPPVKSDWNINIEGTIAWCTYIEAYKLDRLDNEAYRSVILKKVGDDWKIVSSNTLLDMSNARLKIPVSEFPAHLQPFFQHWKNEKL